MVIEKMVLGMVSVNTYFYQNDDGQTVIIDPGDEAEKVIRFVDEKGLKPIYVLLTHGHFDHIMAVPELLEHYKIPLAYPASEQTLLLDADKNMSGIYLKRPLSLKADKLLQDGELFDPFGGPGALKVLVTPGHTEGSTSYYSADAGLLFSGDTLFRGSVGRTDHYSGDMDTEIRSIIEKLYVLPEDTRVYPGHGEETSIGWEKRNNPFTGAGQ